MDVYDERFLALITVHDEDDGLLIVDLSIGESREDEVGAALLALRRRLDVKAEAVVDSVGIAELPAIASALLDTMVSWHLHVSGITMLQPQEVVIGVSVGEDQFGLHGHFSKEKS